MQRLRKLVTAAALAAVAIGGVALQQRQVYDHPAKYIVMHHQAGEAWTRPEQARTWFVDVKGYADVAYNVLITPKGEVWKGRGEEFQSAANLGINRDAVAFCLLGDLDKHPPTDAQLLASGRWVHDALKRHPGAKLIQHRDVARLTGDPSVGTECPGAFSVKTHAARTVFLLASGFPLAEAKRRAQLAAL
jgi:hypothetical protein